MKRLALALVLIGFWMGESAAAPSFFLPEKLYAVTGLACRVYFARQFDSYTPDRYVLEAISPVGNSFADHWSFVPAAADAGKSFPLVLNAWSDEAGLAASATTTVVVAGCPADDSRTRRVALALLAASDTNCLYQDRLRQQMRAHGYFGYVAVGSHTGHSASLECEPGKGAPHDGYGGYSWGSFLHQYALTVEEIDNVQSEGEREQLWKFGCDVPCGQEWRKALLKSPLLALKGGVPALDIQGWFDRINEGKAPEVVVIALGGNGPWIQRPDSRQDMVRNELANARKLVAALRKAAPETTVAITTSMGGSFDQDGWGRNYGAQQHALIAHRAFLDYNRTMQAFCKEFGDGRVVFVPVSQAVDPVGSYYCGKKDGNALHCKPEGGVQMGDALFAWLVNHLEARRQSAGASVVPPDRIEAAEGVSVRVDEGGEITLVAPESPVEEVRLVWSRRHAPSARICRNDWERDYTEAGWTTLTNSVGSAWYFLVREGARVDGWGVAVQPNALCWWTVSETEIALTLDVRAGGAPLLLGNRVLSAARLVMRRGREGESAFAAGRAFCRMMCPAPRLPREPVYGYNDWYCAYGKNTATNFLADAAFVTTLAKGLENRPYVVMDDGWQPNSPPVVATLEQGFSGWGPWDRSGNGFGMEMKSFAAAVASLEAKPGLWYRPYRAWKEVPEGQKLKTNAWYFDPTAPGVKERIADDIARFRAWGFKLVKIDYLVGDVAGALAFPSTVGGRPFRGDCGWRDVTRTSAEVLLDHYRTMRAAAGDDVVLIGCNAFDHLIAGIFELQRIGGDTSGWEWKQTKEMGVNALGARALHDGLFYAADADCVGLAKAGAVDWRLNRQWLDLVSRSGTPLFLSWQRSLATDEVRMEFREAFRRASVRQATAEPLDWEKERFPRRWKFADGTEVTYDWD